MAKFEHSFAGDFYSFVSVMEKEILRGSFSASLEEQSNWQVSGVLCAVRVFERYSAMGSNRVSLSVTVLGAEGRIYVTAVAAGGSQAMLFKVNTFGEEAFLEKLVDVIRRFEKS